MANALRRVLEVDEVVVLKRHAMAPPYRDLENRLIRVSGGFGMKPFTRGTALAAQHLDDGEQYRYEGYDVDPKETAMWQEQYGRFGERWTGVDKTQKGAGS